MHTLDPCFSQFSLCFFFSVRILHIFRRPFNVFPGAFHRAAASKARNELWLRKQREIYAGSSEKQLGESRGAGRKGS